MEMGFEEMPTNKWVESSFWNFDALFQPQSHPARDAHDTFFMKEPMFANSVPEEYYEVIDCCFVVYCYLLFAQYLYSVFFIVCVAPCLQPVH